MKQTQKNRPRRPVTARVLPRETLELSERGELLLSGVCGIEGYAPDRIRVGTVRGFVVVEGKGLTLCWAGEKRLMIRGRVEHLAFL